jgi:hypothetical protein
MEMPQEKPEQKPFLAYMRGWESERAFAARQAVEGLMEHPGWDVLVGLVETATKATYDQMKYTQKPLEQAEYAQLHGRIAGLESIVPAAEAVLVNGQRVDRRLASAAEAAGE